MRTYSLTYPLTGRLLQYLALAGLALACMTLLGSPMAYAQVFNSGSTGADGALDLTGQMGTIPFDPTNPTICRRPTLPCDPEGDNIYHFTTITIPAGVTVRLSAREINSPVFLLASGAVQIDGVIDLNGGVGYDGTSIPATRIPSVPGAGGYPGGIGGSQSGPAQPGSGPAGGSKGIGNDPGSGGGNPGNRFLVPLLGGSGGGGSQAGCGGGAGGGALLIASSQSISIRGTIQANGGQGGVSGCASSQGAGGSGSGGSLRLVSPLISGTGALSALGGFGNGIVQGGSGIIRLEAFQHAFTGNTHPGRILASPFALFLPSVAASSLQVVSVDGNHVASDPTGSFTMPDVTFNAATAVPVLIEAHNVPLGTIVKLHLFSENGPDQILDSSPLAGTPEVSHATAFAVIPPGFSHGFVRATW